MPIQTFTIQEITVLQQAAQKLMDNGAFAAARENMTKAEMKTSDSAAIQTHIDSITASIAGIDDKYTMLKANELSSLNDSLAFYQGLQTKILNTPE